MSCQLISSFTSLFKSFLLREAFPDQPKDTYHPWSPPCHFRPSYSALFLWSMYKYLILKYIFAIFLSVYLYFPFECKLHKDRNFIISIVVFPLGGTRGSPPKSEFIYKTLRIYSYMFEHQSPSKYSSLNAIHLSRHFWTSENNFWLIDLDAF